MSLLYEGNKAHLIDFLDTTIRFRFYSCDIRITAIVNLCPESFLYISFSMVYQIKLNYNFNFTFLMIKIFNSSPVSPILEINLYFPLSAVIIITVPFSVISLF